MTSPLCLNDIKPGEKARVCCLTSSGSIRRRFLDIGLVENTLVECVGKTERSRICLAGKDPDDRCVRVISTGSTADVIGNSDLGGSSSGYLFCFSEFECRI